MGSGSSTSRRPAPVTTPSPFNTLPNSPTSPLPSSINGYASRATKGKGGSFAQVESVLLQASERSKGDAKLEMLLHEALDRIDSLSREASAAESAAKAARPNSMSTPPQRRIDLKSLRFEVATEKALDDVMGAWGADISYTAEPEVDDEVTEWLRATLEADSLPSVPTAAASEFEADLTEAFGLGDGRGRRNSLLGNAIAKTSATPSQRPSDVRDFSVGQSPDPAASADGAAAGQSEEQGSRRAASRLPAPPSMAPDFWVIPEAMARCLDGDLFRASGDIDRLDAPALLAAACPEATPSAGSSSEGPTAPLDAWELDAIRLDELSGGHALVLLGEALCERHGLYDSPPCSLDRSTVRRFLLALEAAYGSNPYHNSIHGADVAFSVHLFLTRFGLSERLTKLEMAAAVFGALIHDFNHPGSNNAHEVRTRTSRSITHSDASVLERHHLHSAFTLLMHGPVDIFAQMAAEDRAMVRKLIVDMVLATDLSRHFEFLSTLRQLANEHGASAAAGDSYFVEGGAQKPPSPLARASSGRKALLAPSTWRTPFANKDLVDVQMLLNVAVKFADLGHSFKLPDQHRKWTERVTNEFWSLGDLERAKGLTTLSPLCDRNKDTNIPKSQIGFFNFVCKPFYFVVADLVDPRMTPWQRLEANLSDWQAAAKEGQGA